MFARNSGLPGVAALALMLLAAISAEAEIITYGTGGFDDVSPIETGWGVTGTVTTGRWSLSYVSGNNNGRTGIDNNTILGYNPPTPYPSPPQYAQVSTNSAASYGSITDTTGLALASGDQVGISLYFATTSGGGAPFSVSLLGPETLSLGTLTPTATSWTSFSTSQVQISTAGTYRVSLVSQSVSGDRTTFVDSVAYNATIVPEPSTPLMLATGLVGLLASACWRRR